MITTEQVEKLMIDYHDRQMRRDGQPYYTHPLAVAKIARKVAGNNFSGNEINQIIQIALLHDVLEDTPVTPARLRDEKVDPRVIRELHLLNKHNFNSYANMLVAIGGSEFATIVKFADLTHNLIGATGNQKDKYEIARMWLSARRPYLKLFEGLQ